MHSSLVTTVLTPRKCSAPRDSALQAVGHAEHLDGGREPGGVDLLDRRGEEHIDAGLGGEAGVVLLPSRIFFQVCAFGELRRVDEQRDDDQIALLAGPLDERQMAGVQRAHRRHQPDHTPVATVRSERCAQLIYGAQRPHGQATWCMWIMGSVQFPWGYRSRLARAYRCGQPATTVCPSSHMVDLRRSAVSTERRSAGSPYHPLRG